ELGWKIPPLITGFSRLSRWVGFCEEGLRPGSIGSTVLFSRPGDNRECSPAVSTAQRMRFVASAENAPDLAGRLQRPRSQIARQGIRCALETTGHGCAKDSSRHGWGGVSRVAPHGPAPGGRA